MLADYFLRQAKGFENVIAHGFQTKWHLKKCVQGGDTTYLRQDHMLAYAQQLKLFQAMAQCSQECWCFTVYMHALL